jgi:dolichyl-phosphate beta-glucosyltransferase
MDKAQISLVIPTYRPGKALEKTWIELSRFVSFQPDAWEVLFVCDGCPDFSQERLSQLVRETQATWCRVLSYAENRGKGYAVRAGLRAAHGAVRLFTDVDLAYSFSDLLEVVGQLQAGAAAVIANREHPLSTVELPFHLFSHLRRRRLQSGIFNCLVRALLGVQARDTQAGLKGMSATVAEQLLPRLACHGFSFDCELLVACDRMGIPITEIPAHVKYVDSASTTGAHSFWSMLKDLWRIRRQWGGELPPMLGMDQAVQEFSLSARQAA